MERRHSLPVLNDPELYKKSSGTSSYGGYGKSYGSSSYGVGESPSMRSYGSQLSLTGSSAGRSSYGGSSYDYGRRPSSSVDRSLTYASTNLGNVSSLKDKFGGYTPSSSRYSSSLDRGYGGSSSRASDYSSRTGYTSDADGPRSYGTSYGRSSSSVGIGRQSSLYSKPASREVSPVRTTSRTDYGRSPSVSRDYTSRDYGSRSRDMGTSYGTSYTKRSDLGTDSGSRTLKTKDYSLTPFSTRRTARTSDANLTPFSTRRGPSVEPTSSSTTKESNSSTKDAKEEAKAKPPTGSSRLAARRKILGSDDSSDSAHEPDGGNRDTSIRFLTSRACDPMEPDFEFYESNKEARKNKKRKRLIARTKTKTYPVKVYKRKRDKPRTSNREVQVDIEELDKHCGRYKYDKDKYARMKQERLSGYRDKKSSRNSSSSQQEDDRKKSDSSRRHSSNKTEPTPERKPPEPKESVVSSRKSKWEQLPQTRDNKKSVLPKQSGFKSKVSRPSTAVEDTSDYEDSSVTETEPASSVANDEEYYAPRQTSYQERQRKLAEEQKKKSEKEKKSKSKEKTMPLTMENMSLKDSIEKVRNWKRQLSNVTPDSPVSPRTMRSSKSTDNDSVFTEDEDQPEDLEGEPIIYGKNEYKAKTKPKSSTTVKQSAFKPRDRHRPSQDSRHERLLSPTGSEESGFLKEDSPNRDASSARDKRKMYAGVPEFPVQGKEKQRGKDTLHLGKNKANRSPSPYDNVDRPKQKGRPSKNRTDDEYDDRPPSPYDNNSLERNPPSIVIDRVGNQHNRNGQMMPADSIDSLATSYMSEDGDFASGEETDISRAQSMVSLNTFPSSSLPRQRKLIPKAMSMDSLAASTSSLPDLVQSSEGSRRGFISRVQDIDAFLGLTEDEDEFTEFSDEESDSLQSADERYASKASLRERDNDSVALSPLKEDDEYTDDDTDSQKTSKPRVEEIIYISDNKKIEDVLGDDEPFQTNSPNIIDNFQMEDITENMPSLALDLPLVPTDKGSSESLLDTPVPDTPDLPLAPVLPLGGDSSFNFPPQRTQSVDQLEPPKKDKHKSLDTRAKSVADIDYLENLFGFTEMPKQNEDNEFFDAFEELPTKDGHEESDHDEEPKLLDFDLVDSTRIREPAKSSSPVPTAKLIDFSSDSNQSTPRRGSPASRRYSPDYSKDAIKQTMALQEKNGVVTMKNLLNVCSRPKQVKPPWIEDEEDRQFKGYSNTWELLEGLHVDVKKVYLHEP